MGRKMHHTQCLPYPLDLFYGADGSKLSQCQICIMENLTVLHSLSTSHSEEREKGEVETKRGK